MKQQLLKSATLTLLAISIPASQGLARPAQNRAARTAVKSSKAARSWVVLKATTNQKRYAVGGPIQVRLRAINTAKRSAYLRFTSGQRFDLSVYPVGKNEAVYTWSASRMFIQSLGSLWLRPGQSQNFDATIGEEMGTLAPGKYRLVARLTNSPRPIEAMPVYFEVVRNASQKTSQSAALSLTARTDKTTYKMGEPVRIEVAAINATGKEQRLQFDSGLDCDVTITDEAGKPVWNYGANLRFIRALGEVTWQKGETKNYTRIWEGVAQPQETISNLQPGRYRVQAFLHSTPQLSAPPLYIQITR